MSVPVTQVSRGNVFDMDDQLYEVVDTEHVKPGKGPAYVQMKYRSLKNGRLLEKRFNSSDTLDKVHIDEKKMEYLYQDGASYVFMDTETYDQVNLDAPLVEDKMGFIKPNETCSVAFRGKEALSVVLPTHVVLAIEECDPASKQSGTNVLKAAKLETGLEVKVPLYCEPGTLAKIDTRSGEFVERVNVK